MRTVARAFCGDVHEQLVLYKRLANLRHQVRLDSMQEELIDRFGCCLNRRKRIDSIATICVILGRPLDLR